MERDRPHPGYEPGGCEITTSAPPCDVGGRPYGAAAEYRVFLTLDGIPDDRLEDLLDELLRVAPTNGPVVGGGPAGSATDVTLALEASDAVAAVDEAARLVRHALVTFPWGSKIVGVSTEVAPS